MYPSGHSKSTCYAPRRVPRWNQEGNTFAHMRMGALVMVGIGIAVLALVGWSAHDKEQAERVRVVEMARFDYRMKVGLRNTLAQLRSPKALEADSDADTAERAYMEACKACSSAMECERDRLVIASGRASDSYNPCN